MKTTTWKSIHIPVWLAAGTGTFFLALTVANAAAIEEDGVAVIAATGAAVERPANPTAPAPPAAPAKPRAIVIEAIEPAVAWRTSKEATWLGVSAEEASEALTAQLGLSSGEGLVVSYVAADSPAAKAGFKKNDVLVEFRDQLLVHPAQLRKLVQSHKEGDTVSLSFYRAGKKEKLSVTLSKTTTSDGGLFEGHLLPGNLEGLHQNLGQLKLDMASREHEMKALHESLAKSGFDKGQLNIEIRRSMDEARKAIHEAMRATSNAHGAIGPAARELEALARLDADAGKHSTVIVKRDRKSVNTVVKTDDTGTYVILVGSKKHLTVHDKDGKLVFDGEIDTTAQQKRVPKSVWEKVEPMLEEIGKPKAGKTEVEADSDKDSNP